MAQMSNWVKNDPERARSHSLHPVKVSFSVGSSQHEPTDKIQGSLFIFRPSTDKVLDIYFSDDEIIGIASDVLKEMSDSELIGFLAKTLADRKPKQ